MTIYQDICEQKYEAFRPKLEQMITEGKLAEYMRNRFQAEHGSRTEPFLESWKGDSEEPERILNYYLKNNISVTPIMQAAEKLFRELENNDAMTQDGWYLSNLRMLFYNVPKTPEYQREAQRVAETIIDVLAKKGIPSGETHFSEYCEAHILNSFIETIHDTPKDKATAKMVFSAYLDNETLCQKGIVGLLRVSYAEGIIALPRLIDQCQDCSYFDAAWHFVQAYDAEKVARDVGR